MQFTVFDIETRIDKKLLNEAWYEGEGLGENEAYERFRAERGNDFPPLPLHVPISTAIGSVGPDHVLRSVESLALEDYGEERLVREFWARAERFSGCLVSFNGRRFDLPVLELSALRHGIPVPTHFAEQGSARSRYSLDRHLDLLDFLTNHGAVVLGGGINLLLKMIGMPGKVGIAGGRVQELYEAGRLEEIHRYCRSDVIQTYFLFLRVELVRGRLDESAYLSAREASAGFLDALRAGGA